MHFHGLVRTMFLDFKYFVMLSSFCFRCGEWGGGRGGVGGGGGASGTLSNYNVLIQKRNSKATRNVQMCEVLYLKSRITKLF